MADKFYKIYDYVLSDEHLSYPEKILYGVIVRLAKNGEKQCYASNKALSEIMHCGKSSIKSTVYCGGNAVLYRAANKTAL